ncbi:uncharacterized protein IWZ02DRAFT_113707 [Phyllosticta citriasiana]|uniref:uncharacterized protein n=1 Tax=Phyllosticta citriasiana TaxID=595635 RepID=UPI0030FDE8BD
MHKLWSYRGLTDGGSVESRLLSCFSTKASSICTFVQTWPSPKVLLDKVFSSPCSSRVAVIDSCPFNASCCLAEDAGSGFFLVFSRIIAGSLFSTIPILIRLSAPKIANFSLFVWCCSFGHFFSFPISTLNLFS